jgi:hypothetical protein
MTTKKKLKHDYAEYLLGLLLLTILAIGTIEVMEHGGYNFFWQAASRLESEQPE